MYRFLIILIFLPFIMAGCTEKKKPTPTVVLEEIEEEQLTEQEKQEDQEIADTQEKKQQLIEEVGVEDIAEKKEVLKEKKKIEKAKAKLEKEIVQVLKKRAEIKTKRIFQEKVATKIKKDSKLSVNEIEELLIKTAKGEVTEEELKKVLIEKLGLSKEEVEEIAKKGGKEALLARVLEETTTLTKKEIAEVVKEVRKIEQETKELAKKLAAATTAEEVREILEKAGDITEEEIAAIVEKAKEVIVQEKNFLRETMAKLYARLQRDRRLQIDDAFCKLPYEGILDHLLFKPTYFATDKANIGGHIEAIQRDVDLMMPILLDYSDVYLQLEGNTDVRAGNDYNKALGERRWQTPRTVMGTIIPEGIRLEGRSLGEECQLARLSGESTKNWWTRNRRTDYMFKLE